MATRRQTTLATRKPSTTTVTKPTTTTVTKPSAVASPAIKAALPGASNTAKQAVAAQTVAKVNTAVPKPATTVVAKPPVTQIANPTVSTPSATTLAIGGSRDGISNMYVPPKPSGDGSSSRDRSYTPRASSQAPQQGEQGLPPGMGGDVTLPQAQPQTLQSADPGRTGGGGGFTGVRQDFANASASDKAEMAAMMNGMLGYIDQMGSDVMAQIRSQMGMDDPETANALAMIRQEADAIYKEMLEDLNAKGLVQSGIYAEAQDRIAKSQGMQVSNFVAQRFGDLQNQLNQAMMSMGQMRVGAMSQGMGMVNQNMMNDRNTQAQMGMQNLGNELTQRGQDLQNQQFGQQFDWAKQTDTRNFGYQQQRDAVGDQQFGQSLAASRAASAGGGQPNYQNTLGWQELQYTQKMNDASNAQYAFEQAQQLVSSTPPPKTMEEYNRIVAYVNANPMLAQNPQAKEYALSQIPKPQIQQQTSMNQSAWDAQQNQMYKNNPMQRFTPANGGYTNPYPNR